MTVIIIKAKHLIQVDYVWAFLCGRVYEIGVDCTDDVDDNIDICDEPDNLYESLNVMMPDDDTLEPIQIPNCIFDNIFPGGDTMTDCDVGVCMGVNSFFHIADYFDSSDQTLITISTNLSKNHSFNSQYLDQHQTSSSIECLSLCLRLEPRRIKLNKISKRLVKNFNI
ncbi:hypothetical protein DERP_011255 [Dermatophagoides pteronyssinus]|uniref:Uncharacterized protein n=1 Tax=Dermatophagoides pteronyssinus TaxID=6956 RepID=A0ABQ8JCJ8_DERPT|nr:hypothetical protein DERP_011255 [Dermatophagoides pteronyssinus]